MRYQRVHLLDLVCADDARTAAVEGSAARRSHAWTRKPRSLCLCVCVCRGVVAGCASRRHVRAPRGLHGTVPLWLMLRLMLWLVLLELLLRRG